MRLYPHRGHGIEGGRWAVSPQRSVEADRRWGPTLEIAGHVLLARLSWFQRDAKIEKVFYPVFPPDKNAGDVLAWLRSNPAR